MLLEDINPLHYNFKIGDLDFKAEDFDDMFIDFIVRDAGGMQVGGITVTFDAEGENIEVSDTDHPGTLNRIQKAGDSDALSRQIKKAVKSTL